MRVTAKEFQAPGFDGSTGCLGVVTVPGKDIVQPLLVEHGDGFTQAVQ